jgi:hypothetical protein
MSDVTRQLQRIVILNEAKKVRRIIEERGFVGYIADAIVSQFNAVSIKILACGGPREPLSRQKRVILLYCNLEYGEEHSWGARERDSREQLLIKRAQLRVASLLMQQTQGSRHCEGE